MSRMCPELLRPQILDADVGATMRGMEIWSHDDLLHHAKQRAYAMGVGAAFSRDITEPGRDSARRWRFLVADPAGRWAYVDFLALHITRGADLLVTPLERAVERFVANNYPRETRMESLLADHARYKEGLLIRLRQRDLQRRELLASIEA